MISLWLPVALFMAGIYVGAALPQMPGPAGAIPDTVTHGAGYFALALLTLRATSGARWAGVTGRTLVLAFLIAVAHGASVEIEQMFIPTRMAEWRDLANDAMGAGAGLLVAWAWSKMNG